MVLSSHRLAVYWSECKSQSWTPTLMMRWRLGFLPINTKSEYFSIGDQQNHPGIPHRLPTSLCLRERSRAVSPQRFEGNPSLSACGGSIHSNKETINSIASTDRCEAAATTETHKRDGAFRAACQSTAPPRERTLLLRFMGPSLHAPGLYTLLLWDNLRRRSRVFLDLPTRLARH